MAFIGNYVGTNVAESTIRTDGILELPWAGFVGTIAAMTLETFHATVVPWRCLVEDRRRGWTGFSRGKVSNIDRWVTLPSFY
jgi:hypothetical protein